MCCAAGYSWECLLTLAAVGSPRVGVILPEQASCLSLQVEELNLDNVRASKLQGLTSQFTSLKRLSIINVGLSSLEDFPELPTLERVSGSSPLPS